MLYKQSKKLEVKVLWDWFTFLSFRNNNKRLIISVLGLA